MSCENLNTAALVLAGGKSRRMGRDKALLKLPPPHQQLTLLQHTCNIAQACVSRTYVLTAWPDRYMNLLPSSVALLQEQRTNAGPLVALAQGWSIILAGARTNNEPAPDWLLVLACDMPALDRATIQTWQRGLHHISKDAIATLPRQNNQWEPLCGFYHHRCIASLQTAIENNLRSFQPWLANETVIPLTLQDSNMLRNCNTPAQWQSFLASINARNP